MKYKVLKESFIIDRLYQEGEIVEYNSSAGPNLEPLKKSSSKTPSKGPSEVEGLA